MPRQKVSEEHKRQVRNSCARKNYPKYKEYREAKLRCECGALVSRAYMSDHKKKNKHIDMMNFLKDNNVCIPVNSVESDTPSP